MALDFKKGERESEFLFFFFSQHSNGMQFLVKYISQKCMVDKSVAGRINWGAGGKSKYEIKYREVRENACRLSSKMMTLGKGPGPRWKAPPQLWLLKCLSPSGSGDSRGVPSYPVSSYPHCWLTSNFWARGGDFNRANPEKTWSSGRARATEVIV